MTSENKASDNRAGETKAGENKTGGWTIGFDGDDTLWHNESIFSMTQEKFRAMLGEAVAAAGLAAATPALGVLLRQILQGR